jgi:hypothetical protein
MAVRKTSALVVRLTHAQRRAFELRASADGLSLSAWVRMMLLREAQERAEDELKMRLERRK